MVPQAQVIPKPASIPWEVAGALFVAGTTAYAAVRAVNVKVGDTVAVSGASSGVGTLVVQLARLRGARVLGIASPARADWLTAHGVEPVPYSDDLQECLLVPADGHLDAFIDTHGQGYVQFAIKLSIDSQRINTIIDFGGDKCAVNVLATVIHVQTTLYDKARCLEVQIERSSTSVTFPATPSRNPLLQLRTAGFPPARSPTPPPASRHPGGGMLGSDPHAALLQS